MSVIPCDASKALKTQVDEYAEVLKAKAHTLGGHGLSEAEFYDSGLFRGAIERIRGQFSATMKPKRDFVATVLDYMQKQQVIAGWNSAGESNRHDYTVDLISGKTAAIELKGCLDGNNTNIFERPPNAHEFIIWSICSNAAASPRHNVWSGIHTRLSAEIISKSQQIDGLIVWDMVCGTLGRPCPKVKEQGTTDIGSYKLPPPCLYLFPSTIPNVRHNPNPACHDLEDLELIRAFASCFNAKSRDIHKVRFAVENHGREVVRTTEICKDNKVVKTSKPTTIKR